MAGARNVDSSTVVLCGMWLVDPRGDGAKGFTHALRLRETAELSRQDRRGGMEKNYAQKRIREQCEIIKINLQLSDKEAFKKALGPDLKPVWSMAKDNFSQARSAYTSSNEARSFNILLRVHDNVTTLLTLIGRRIGADLDIIDENKIEAAPVNTPDKTAEKIAKKNDEKSLGKIMEKMQQSHDIIFRKLNHAKVERGRIVRILRAQNGEETSSDSSGPPSSGGTEGQGIYVYEKGMANREQEADRERMAAEQEAEMELEGLSARKALLEEYAKDGHSGYSLELTIVTATSSGGAAPAPDSLGIHIPSPKCIDARVYVDVGEVKKRADELLPDAEERLMLAGLRAKEEGAMEDFYLYELSARCIAAFAPLPKDPSKVTNKFTDVRDVARTTDFLSLVAHVMLCSIPYTSVPGEDLAKEYSTFLHLFLRNMGRDGKSYMVSIKNLLLLLLDWGVKVEGEAFRVHPVAKFLFSARRRFVRLEESQDLQWWARLKVITLMPGTTEDQKALIMEIAKTDFMCKHFRPQAESLVARWPQKISQLEESAKKNGWIYPEKLNRQRVWGIFKAAQTGRTGLADYTLTGELEKQASDQKRVEHLRPQLIKKCFETKIQRGKEDDEKRLHLIELLESEVDIHLVREEPVPELLQERIKTLQEIKGKKYGGAPPPGPSPGLRKALSDAAASSAAASPVVPASASSSSAGPAASAPPGAEPPSTPLAEPKAKKEPVGEDDKSASSSPTQQEQLDKSEPPQSFFGQSLGGKCAVEAAPGGTQPPLRESDPAWQKFNELRKRTDEHFKDLEKRNQVQEEENGVEAPEVQHQRQGGDEAAAGQENPENGGAGTGERLVPGSLEIIDLKGRKKGERTLTDEEFERELEEQLGLEPIKGGAAVTPKATSKASTPKAGSAVSRSKKKDTPLASSSEPKSKRGGKKRDSEAASASAALSGRKSGAAPAATSAVAKAGGKKSIFEEMIRKNGSLTPEEVIMEVEHREKMSELDREMEQNRIRMKEREEAHNAREQRLKRLERLLDDKSDNLTKKEAEVEGQQSENFYFNKALEERQRELEEKRTEIKREPSASKTRGLPKKGTGMNCTGDDPAVVESDDYDEVEDEGEGWWNPHEEQVEPEANGARQGASSSSASSRAHRAPKPRQSVSRSRSPSENGRSRSASRRRVTFKDPAEQENETSDGGLGAYLEKDGKMSAREKLQKIAEAQEAALRAGGKGTSSKKKSASGKGFLDWASAEADGLAGEQPRGPPGMAANRLRHLMSNGPGRSSGGKGSSALPVASDAKGQQLRGVKLLPSLATLRSRSFAGVAPHVFDKLEHSVTAEQIDEDIEQLQKSAELWEKKLKKESDEEAAIRKLMKQQQVTAKARLDLIKAQPAGEQSAFSRALAMSHVAEEAESEGSDGAQDPLTRIRTAARPQKTQEKVHASTKQYLEQPEARTHIGRWHKSQTVPMELWKVVRVLYLPDFKESVLNPRLARELRHRIAKHFEECHELKEAGSDIPAETHVHDMLCGALLKTTANDYFAAHDAAAVTPDLEHNFCEDLVILAQSGLLQQLVFLEFVDKLAAKEIAPSSLTSTLNLVWPFQYAPPDRTRTMQTFLKIVQHAASNGGNLYRALGFTDRPTLSALRVDLSKFRQDVEVVRSCNGYNPASADTANIERICSKYNLKNVVSAMIWLAGFWRGPNLAERIQEFRERMNDDNLHRVFIERARRKGFKQKKQDEAYIKKLFNKQPTNTDVANPDAAADTKGEGGKRGRARGRWRGKGDERGDGGPPDPPPQDPPRPDTRETKGGGKKRPGGGDKGGDQKRQRTEDDKDRSEASYTVQHIKKEVEKLYCTTVEEVSRAKVCGWHLGGLCGIIDGSTKKPFKCRNDPARCRDKQHTLTDAFKKELKLRSDAKT
eukprot:g7423.t1